MPKILAPIPITGNKQLDDLLKELKQVISGLGGVSEGMINSDNSPGFHNGETGGHKEIIQGDNITDSTATTLFIASINAGGTYTAAEQTLLNEIKTDLNLLIMSYNALLAKHNQHLEKHRSQKLLK